MSKESGRRSILIVEDNELNREMLCAMLEDRYHVFQAENGKEGLEVLQEHYRNISIIVLDVQMPVMNGYEFLKVVKDDDLLKEIPVIVATGSNDVEEEERCLELGATDFVIKPYKRNIVLKRISNIIRLRESASTLREVEYDDLTGIFTRQAFYHHAERVLRENPNIDFTLAISDIQDFTLVKERYGTKVAEELLLKNVALMRRAQVENYIYGRYDDNQFVVMAPSSERYMETRRRNKGALTLPLPEEGAAVLKFGVKRDIAHDIPVREHCRHALMALDTVKHVYGQNYAWFDDNMQKFYDRRVAIERSMVNALKRDEFQIYYQPKHDSRTGRLVGAEALVRWTHPEFGFLSPAEFIPVFEQTGFISESNTYTATNAQGLRNGTFSDNTTSDEFILLQHDLYSDLDLRQYLRQSDAYDLCPNYLQQIPQGDVKIRVQLQIKTIDGESHEETINYDKLLSLNKTTTGDLFTWEPEKRYIYYLHIPNLHAHEIEYTCEILSWDEVQTSDIPIEL